MRVPLTMDVYDMEAAEDMMKMMHDAHEQVASQGFLRTNR